MLGSMSITHWVVVIAVVAVLFGGKNKISNVMGDIGRGFGALKRGLSEDGEIKQDLVKIEHEIKKDLNV